MNKLSDEKLEALLRRAEPRPAPDAVREAEARAAVHAEWQRKTRAYSRRNSTRWFALAASVLLAAFATVSLLPPTPLAPVQVASIEKSFGSIYILEQSSRLTPADNLHSIRSGQTIRTGENTSGLALRWHAGGSLRLDSDTELEFVDEGTIRLRQGRLYFDTRPAELLAGAAGSRPALTIETAYGPINHLGTQYMVSVDSTTMAVTVREGAVEVGTGRAATAVESGKRGIFSNGGQPTLLDVAGFGKDWQWISATSPAVDVDGHSIADLLTWASRELGYDVRYAAASVERTATEETLVGTIDMPPQRAVETWMSTTGIDWRIEGGVIYVGKYD